MATDVLVQAHRLSYRRIAAVGPLTKGLSVRQEAASGTLTTSDADPRSSATLSVIIMVKMRGPFWSCWNSVAIAKSTPVFDHHGRCASRILQLMILVTVAATEYKEFHSGPFVVGLRTCP